MSANEVTRTQYFDNLNRGCLLEQAIQDSNYPRVESILKNCLGRDEDVKVPCAFEAAKEGITLNEDRQNATPDSYLRKAIKSVWNSCYSAMDDSDFSRSEAAYDIVVALVNKGAIVNEQLKQSFKTEFNENKMFDKVRDTKSILCELTCQNFPISKKSQETINKTVNFLIARGAEVSFNEAFYSLHTFITWLYQCFCQSINSLLFSAKAEKKD